jgi:hypothetical protein
VEYRHETNGLLTLLEHWGLTIIPVSAILVSQVVIFFVNLSGARFIWCYALGLLFAGVGVALIFYAKLPFYRQRRFFTFGSGVLPENKRAFYRWGYRCIGFAVVLLLCLLLSTP